MSVKTQVYKYEKTFMFFFFGVCVRGREHQRERESGGGQNGMGYGCPSAVRCVGGGGALRVQGPVLSAQGVALPRTHGGCRGGGRCGCLGHNALAVGRERDNRA